MRHFAAQLIKAFAIGHDRAQYSFIADMDFGKSAPERPQIVTCSRLSEVPVMPVFHVHPADGSSPPTEITAQDASAVLGSVNTLACREAHIYQDSEYTFSVRLGAHDLWCIFQRP